MKIKFFSLILLSLLTMGCSQSTIPKHPFTYYTCDNNQSFEIAFLNKEQSAVLRLLGDEHHLKEVPSASGVQYVVDDEDSNNDSHVILWTKGDKAMIEINGIIYRNCLMDK